MPELASKIEKRIKERERLVNEIQAAIDILAPAIKKLVDSDLKTYSMLSKPDCLWSDSPISNFNTYKWIKEHMIKRDMDFIGFALDGKPSLKTFGERSKELVGWVMRFSNEPEKEKTGIDAIL